MTVPAFTRASWQDTAMLGTAIVVPAPPDEWARVVAADADGLITQTPEWVAAVSEVRGGRDATRLYRWPDGTTAVLPLVRRGWGRAAVLESMPYAWGFGGLLTDSPVTPEMATTVFGDLQRAGVLRVHLRPNPLHIDAWSSAATDVGSGITVIPRVAHVLSLEGGYDEVWQHRFTSNTRRHVRQAEKAGVEVATDTAGGLVPEFYDLLLRSFDRWAGKQHEPRALARWRGTHRDPRSKFETISRHLHGGAHILLARVQGQAAAAILVLQGRNAHYTRGAMIQELAGPSHANSLLHARAIEAACQAGCATYHMGETGNDEGLARFKSRFGAVAHDYAEYRLERLPLTRAEQLARGAVKRVVRFRD